MLKNSLTNSFFYLLLVVILCIQSSLAYAQKKFPTNQQPMYGNIHEMAPKNEAEKKFLERIRAADKRFIKQIIAKGYSRKSGARAMLKRGWQHFEKKEYVVAIKRFNQAWLLDPEYGDPYHGFALISAVRNEAPSLIEKYLQKAISKSSVSVAAHVDYGRFLWTQKKLDKSLIILNRALEIEPRAYNARSHISFVYFLKENFLESCKWGKLAEKNGDSVEEGFVKDMCRR